MAKYSYEFKLQVVQDYLRGIGGHKYLAQKYNIPSYSNVQKWINAYNEFGADGLMRSRKNETYTFEFKLHVVELYLSTEVSYQELALSVGINNPPLITKWVNDFRIAGPDALRPKRKGRRTKVSKPKENKSKTIETVSNNSEYLKQLEDENLKLKAILACTGFPKATYMYWQKRFDRENPNEDLEQRILEIRKENKDFGYRRIYGELRKQGLIANKKRVQRIVQKLGLQVTSFTRKSRKYSSYKGRVGKVSPNRIHRRFETNIPHQKITTDTSEFKYYDIDNKGRMIIKKLYLDPFMDMCNREIISYGISKRPSAESIMNALNEAIIITNDCKYRRTFHSDQGWAYQMKAYRYKLTENKIFQSMSRKGNCHDNSVMENFFGIMKQEMYYGEVYYSYEQLKDTIDKYIKYYNEKRIKEKLGWMSPVEYKLSLLAA
ncbi:IS3 family transposase [Candidatus Galacturonibacter soehngenii]|uniref:IS3 family transposase n=1 Tax=Candidatus Galacturonatibacter soehngenii TaxID=2307010 RepID=A0A7V7QJJ9_9FIRM|nr:IS3 family transposase [Candidatus Galacturonibacter soehngenii]KAB1437819.1 IS3 family transposase [Candidatus Galacturonibacter soehngenii]